MSGNTEQRTFWTDDAGPIWIDQRAVMDAALAGVLEGTLARANLCAGQHVLDIGCGAGTSTLAAARRIGAQGHITGLDISATLLAAARIDSKDHTTVSYLEADAQTYTFDRQSVDTIISRFGVMFFEDSVAAFRNMATALQPDGCLVFSAWGDIAQNPFFTLPAQIARQVLGPIPRSDPDAPGPFAFRNPAHIEDVLSASGYTPNIETVTEQLQINDTAEVMAHTMCQIGPAHMALMHHKADAAAQGRLMEVLVDALAMYETPDGISIPAQINYVTARISA